VTFAEPPASAAWRHVDAREGFEVVFIRREAGGFAIDGRTSAVEGEAWAVAYTIAVDEAWRTRSARVSSLWAGGRREASIEADCAGGWRVDGEAAPGLDGCLDVDLEASAFTNAFPVHRLGLAVGESADAPAAYVRAPDPDVERLEQRYTRIEDEGPHRRFDYEGPAFGFRAVLVYDESGLVLDYPGIAQRTL
jgi:hypothetical protein